MNKKSFCSEVNSAVHGHKWRNLTMVYCNQRNNKFLILFTIDRVVNLLKRGLQSILYLLLFSFFEDWLLNICDASSKEDYDSVEGKVYSEEQMNHTSCKNAASQS